MLVLAFCQDLAFDLCVSTLPDEEVKAKSLVPPAESCTFGAQYSRFALVAYFSPTVLNRVFDKDCVSLCQRPGYSLVHQNGSECSCES